MNRKILITSIAVVAAIAAYFFFSPGKSPEAAKKYAQEGVDFTSEGKYDKAIDRYNDSLGVITDPTVLYNRGVAYMNKGDNDNAIKDFSKVIELQPKNIFALNNRGLINKNKGKFDDAIKDYSQLIKLKPDFAVAYYGRGYSYQMKGEKEKALGDYKKALSLGYTEAKKNIDILEKK